VPETGWGTGSSGNGTSAYIPTRDRVGTVVVWGEAPAGASAAKFEYEGQEPVVVPAENGCALAVFDAVTENEAYLDGPRPRRGSSQTGRKISFRSTKFPIGCGAEVLRVLGEVGAE